MRSPSLFLGKRSTCIIEKYEKTQFLGQGGCGQVVKAVHIWTGWERAIKIIPKGKEYGPARCEAVIQKSLDHPHIVKIFEQFEDEANTYLVMELCEGGNLCERLSHWHVLSESDVGFIMRQILGALRYLHKVGVRHGDLVLENILATHMRPPSKSSLKLADFGAAARTREAWEDLASCGRIMQRMLGAVQVGSQPRAGSTVLNASGVDVAVSRGAKALMDCLLDADKNFSAGDALAHAWMRKFAPRKGVRLPKSFTDQLLAFQSHSKFKQCALQVIADQLGRDQEDQNRELFLELNVNCNGLLTLYEIKRGMQKANLEIPAELHKLLKQIDGDCIGVLDYTTFLAVMLDEKSYRQRDACLSAFSIFDRGGKGFATQDDIAEVLWGRDTDFNIIRGPVGHLVKLVDKDGDGKVSFDEFFDMMCSTSNARSSLRRKERKATLKGIWSPERRFVQAAKYRARECTRVRNHRLSKKLKAKAEKRQARTIARAATSVAADVDENDIANLSDIRDLCSSSDSSAEESEALLEDADTFGDGDAFRAVLRNAIRHGMVESGLGEFMTSSFASYSKSACPNDISFPDTLEACMEDSDGFQEFMPRHGDDIHNEPASFRDVLKAAVIKPEEVREAELVENLSRKRTGQLMRCALADGASLNEIDDALDEENPKDALINLIASKKANQKLHGINDGITCTKVCDVWEHEGNRLQHDGECDKAAAAEVAHPTAKSDCRLAMQYCPKFSPYCPLVCDMCRIVHL